MAFGLTTDGFVIKRLDDIKSEIETSLRDTLGDGINLLPTELLGQIVGILSEREALVWELAEGVYNSQSPEQASGEALDNVVSITGIQRLEATKGTGTVTAYGTLGTVIPEGSIISVSGDSSARFLTTDDFTIGAGTDEVQDIDFSSIPDAGSWTLIFDGEETGTLAFNDNASAVQSALNALPNLSAVTVSGDYTNGFTVTFTGADGEIDQVMLQVGVNTLTTLSVQATISIVETTKGVLPNIDMTVEAESAGLINAYAETLIVIETPVAGWDSAINENDITPGTEIETDAELRQRRLETLATAGAATIDAIRSRILEIDAVSQCRVFENDTMAIDASGRPPKSFETVVLGGDNTEIAENIWDVKPAGIESDGDITVSVTDSQGFAHDVKFSRPTEVDVYLVINITTDDDFPVGGDTIIKENIVSFASGEFTIGNDVIEHLLYTPLNETDGITEAEILLGTAPAPATSNNIIIADDEVADFDTSRITVNVT